MFQEVSAHNAAANRVTRTFNMDRDGFALLVMGWTGPTAFTFKLAYARPRQALRTGPLGLHPMTTTAVALSLPVYDIENEPRVLDTDLAKALGMERPTNIRTRIKGMWTDLEQLGPMH